MVMNKGIYLIFALLLAGCDGGSDSSQSDSAESTSKKVLTSDVVIINEDQYYGVKFRLSRAAQVKTALEILDGPAIEAFLVTEAEYNTWVTITQNGQYTTATLNYFKDLSISPVANKHESKWWKIDSGVYYYILENTDYGSTMPPFNFVNDKATVEFSIAAK